MGKTARYREIARQIILDYAKGKSRNNEVQTEVLMNTECDHYKVMDVGFEGISRVYGSII